MPPFRTACTFTFDDGRACAIRPVVAGYFIDDAIRGIEHIASLCASHDTREAQNYAKSQKLVRVEVGR